MLNPSRRIQFSNIFLDDVSAEEKNAEDKAEMSPSVNPTSKTILEEKNAVRWFLIARKAIARN